MVRVKNRYITYKIIFHDYNKNTQDDPTNSYPIRPTVSSNNTNKDQIQDQIQDHVDNTTGGETKKRKYKCIDVLYSGENKKRKRGGDERREEKGGQK